MKAWTPWIAGLAAVLASPASAQSTVLVQAIHNCTDGTVDLDKRLESCNAVVNAQGLEPDEMAIAYVDLGIVLQLEGKIDDALGAYNKALALKPDLWEGLLDRGFLHLQRGDLDLAVADYKSASGPAASGTYENIDGIGSYRPVQNGQLHDYDSPGRDNGVRDTGIARLRDAVAGALSQRCRNRATSPASLDAAMTDCNAALEIAPALPIAFASRGFVEFVKGDYAAAAKDLEGSPPDLAAAIYFRGVAKHRIGNKAEGDIDIAAAEKMQPGITAAMTAHNIAP